MPNLVFRNFKVVDYNQSPSSLELRIPNGGEELRANEKMPILWNSDNVDTIGISFSSNNGKSWTPIVDKIANTNKYLWTVPNIPSDSCLIKLFSSSDKTVYDISDSVFKISEALNLSINLISPNGGEVFVVDSTAEISWTSENIEYVKIYYSINNGMVWQDLVSRPANQGKYKWHIPNKKSDSCKIKITALNNEEIFAISDSCFVITDLVGITKNNLRSDFSLSQNYPNPFNPDTKIEYYIPVKEFVELSVYNVLGQKITTLVNDIKTAGLHTINFNAGNLSSGMYFYKITAGDFSSLRTMILLK